MKVIIINGSAKASGNTATALHEAEHVLQQQGIETEWIHVGHLQIAGCVACNRCWTTGSCKIGDIVNEISDKMCMAGPEHGLSHQVHQTWLTAARISQDQGRAGRDSFHTIGKVLNFRM